MTGTVSQIGIKENDFVYVIQTTTKTQTAVPQPSASNPANLTSSGPVYWDGMDLGQVMGANKNPAHIVQIVQSKPQLMLQANFHNEELAQIFRKDAKTATKELTKFLMFNSAFSAMSKLKKEGEEEEMKARLEKNKDDEEAKKYFKEKERKQIIDEQYFNIMNEYPESMTRVLMLYINVKINSVDVQA